MTDSGVPSRAEAGRRYLRRGWQPVPVPERTKGPRVPGWQHQRFTEEELPAAFAGPGNIGILLGEPSGGLVDVDLDCDEAVELAERYLPPTPVKTGHGARPGSHWWYIVPGLETKQLRDPDTKAMVMELRSTGAQTLVGPSIHPETAEVYDTLEGEPAAVGAEALITGIKNLYNAVMERRYGRPGPMRPLPPRQPGVDDDERVLRRAELYLDRVPAAISGQGGHSATYTAAVAMVHGFGLSEATALRLLEEKYNPRCQPPWSPKELEHKVRDAAIKGHERPYGWLRDAERGRDGRATGAPAAEPGSPGDDGAGLADDAQDGGDGGAPHLTDLGNAERIAERYLDRLRYCHATGQWLVWDGSRWANDQTGAAMRAAAELTRIILAEAARCQHPAERAARAGWAIKSESRQRQEAMVALARCRPELVLTPKQLDTNRYLLNCLNGTLDLRTGELRPHRREDYLTKLAPVAFDPEAPRAIFNRFLARIFSGSPEVLAFVQRLLGMALTGEIREQLLPIFHGAGANGKNVMLDTICGLMGDYAGLAPPHLLVASSQREHPTEIADLWGRRLVVASETEEGAVLNLSLIKRLTGDAKLKGRFMRQDYFEFDRTHKIILVTNNRPKIKENTMAVWRRLRLVPFTVVIPPAEQDPLLLEKLTAEWPGVLAWLVQGCLAWQAEGKLPEPEAVAQATRAYRRAEDQIGRFLDERCELDETGVPGHSELFTPYAELLAAYNAWCRSAGETPVEGPQFQEALEKRGFVSAARRLTKGSCKGRVGIALRSRPRWEEEEA